MKFWTIAYWVLFLCWAAAGVLNMAHIRGGFLTNHLADLTMPAWPYIVSRGLWTENKSKTGLLLFVGKTPERSLFLIFLGSALTEISTIFWPKGIFAGTFDPLDLVAYASGLIICYAFDKRTKGYT